MKRLLCFLSGGLLLAGSAHAQLGVRVGGNLANFNHADAQSNNVAITDKAQLGYQVGIYYEVALSPRVSLVPEFAFCRQSSKQTIQGFPIIDFGFEGDYKLTRSQLTLPVVVRLQLGRFYAEAGPQLTYLVGGRQTGTEAIYSFGSSLPVQQVDRPITERLRRFDAGPCLGVGFQPTAALGVSLRAYYGLLTTNVEAGTYTPYPIRYVGPLHQQMLQASLTYQLVTPKS